MIFKFYIPYYPYKQECAVQFYTLQYHLHEGDLLSTMVLYLVPKCSGVKSSAIFEFSALDYPYKHVFSVQFDALWNPLK